MLLSVVRPLTQIEPFYFLVLAGLSQLSLRQQLAVLVVDFFLTQKVINGCVYHS